MTTISAKVIADSVAVSTGVRLTTLQLRYPRFVHSEFMTHRVFSRNASSSRAIPVSRLIADVENDPAMPLFWGKNQPGMQAREELTGQSLRMSKETYKGALRDAVKRAKLMAAYDGHKQLVNRIIEPYSHINVVVTSTEWSNFLELRDHPDAEPHIVLLAQAMKEVMSYSQPESLLDGQWHLPYVDRRTCDPGLLISTEAPGIAGLPPAVKVSAARCARVSYMTHDGKEPEVERDMKLFDDLVGSRPLHASPTEHQATPDGYAPKQNGRPDPLDRRDMHRNFDRWIQLRAMVEEEA